LFVGGVAALTGLIAVNWDQLLNDTLKSSETAGTAVAAIGPRMLLASTGSLALAPGARVVVNGLSAVSGTVIAQLPHAGGPRFQIALDAGYSSVCDSFPSDITLTTDAASTGVVGTVADGSSDVVIEFGPLSQLRLGAPVVLDTEDGALIYQVSSLRLRTTTWNGASAVVPHASARQLGLTSRGWITGVDYLPTPHQVVRDPGTLTDELPDGFCRIGRVKGTQIPVGIQRDHKLRGHVAILGMSGMGKTAVANRIASELGGHELMVALDLTGEYASRLGLPAWDDNLDSIGCSVYEPIGDPTLRAADLVKAVMLHAAGEFTGPGEPQPRNILFEEAHSFIPEWNFATPNQRDNVNNTTRMIMQARKYGLRFIIVSQRTAVVSKSALSQCDSYIVFRTIDHTGLEYIESLAGTSFRDTLATLLKHEALCIGPAFNADRPVVVELDAPALDIGVEEAALGGDAVVAKDQE
jgi:hypothetical protein